MTAELDEADGRTGRDDRAAIQAGPVDDPHCRSLLRCLREADEPIAVPVLARRVAAGVTDTPPEAVPEDLRRRVATWLHHGQLPALAERGLVEFDAEAEEVRPVDVR